MSLCHLFAIRLGWEACMFQAPASRGWDKSANQLTLAQTPILCHRANVLHEEAFEKRGVRCLHANSIVFKPRLIWKPAQTDILAGVWRAPADGLIRGARSPCPKNIERGSPGGALPYFALKEPRGGFTTQIRGTRLVEPHFLDRLNAPPGALTLPKARLLCQSTTGARVFQPVFERGKNGQECPFPYLNSGIAIEIASKSERD